jgi:hypothetical protein
MRPSTAISRGLRARRVRVALAAVLVVGAPLTLALTANTAPLHLAPSSHADGRDVPNSPLDLRRVTFGQQDTQLQLKITTYGTWKASTLSDTGANRLCLSVMPSKGNSGVLCVVQGDGRPALDYMSIDAAGVTSAPKRVEALVGQSDDHTLLAQFPPTAIGLAYGPFRWNADSQWGDQAVCPADTPCLDTAPDQGSYDAKAGLLVQPRCFGAASRDPAHPCDNPDLRATVHPTPSDAFITPNAYCERLPSKGAAEPCAFGLPDAPGRETVLLAGDSHATHWRGAVEVAAQGKGWHAISLTHSGCPLTAHPTNGDAARNATCAKWYSAVRAWIVQHPKVHTLITSSHTLDDTPERRADYQATWAKLPPSITRVVVIRDIPGIVAPQASCVNHQLAAHQPAGLKCAQPKSTTLRPDPNAAAARTSGQKRVHVVDLTRFFCGKSLCLAVVGGVLVRKDGEHMTEPMATTLGPYLMRAIDQIPGG